MKPLKHLAAALTFSSALAGAAAPASAAWDNPNSPSSATARSVDGAGTLSVGCNIGPYLGVTSGADYDTTASYAASVPMLLTADGVDVPLLGVFLNHFGKLWVNFAPSVAAYDADAALAALHAIRDASGPIEIAYSQTRLIFPADNAYDAVSQTLGFCR